MIDKTPERNGRRRHPHELVGPHSDVYALGKSIENGTNLLGLQYETLKTLGNTTLTPDNAPKLELVYTPDLWNLMFSCQNEDARSRPRLHHLHRETKTRMEYCRAVAQVEEEDAFSRGMPGCFHSNVLFKRVDRQRFETDPVFRANYRKANLKPVWEMFGYVPAENLVQSKPSFSLGDEQLFNAEAAHAKAEKGQLRTEARARMAKKIKERKKGKGRVQMGIRGLLSKMNFFS